MTAQYPDHSHRTLVAENRFLYAEIAQLVGSEKTLNTRVALLTSSLLVALDKSGIECLRVTGDDLDRLVAEGRGLSIEPSGDNCIEIRIQSPEVKNEQKNEGESQDGDGALQGSGELFSLLGRTAEAETG
jgi:hypothetical protein